MSIFATALTVLLSHSAAQVAPHPVTGVFDVRPLTSSILQVHYRDGYVIHHTIGHKRSDETVVLDHPLNVSLAGNPETYKIARVGDSAVVRHPLAVARKSKGTDFAWFTDRWAGNHFENDRPDFAAEHWLYLNLQSPLRFGNDYQLEAAQLGINAKIRIPKSGLVSEAIHVNLLGYPSGDPQKFGYLYSWMGDGGSLDVQPFIGKPFRVVDANSGVAVLTGKVAFRKPKQNLETQNKGDTPNGNFLGADVAECDFSKLGYPGRYVLEIEGVGKSHEFSVAVDVYRTAFRSAMQGILGQRSGIELGPPSVPYHRPAPHNPKLTPGFAGKLVYTNSRYIDRKDPDASMDDKPAIEKGIVGPLTVSGWYQDAGDWDSYASHIAVPQQLMLAYQLAPQNFAEGELNLPGKPSPLPDILKEAGWLPRFCYRLRHELIDRKYGTGGIGLRICGDHFGSDTGPKDVGIGSWQDVDRTWTASGEDPVSTFGYAAVSANYALCLDQAGVKDAEGIDWTREAEEAFAWSERNTHPGDEKKDGYKDNKIYASAGLALLSRAPHFTEVLKAETSDFNADTRLWWSRLAGPALYVAASSPLKDPELYAKFKSAILGTADAELSSSKARALRWGGDWGMPMLIGQQTTPWVQAMAVASVITSKSDPAKSREYYGAICTTADYFLGTNPLNQTWVTGLTDSYPKNVFQMDSWYVEGNGVHPGIVPYGPWIKANAQGQGPWDHDWANKSCYPSIDSWPGAERWFSNRCCPMTGEFTIWQNIAPTAFTYGFLCGSSRR